MTQIKRYLPKGAEWVFIQLTLMVMASYVSALDLPGFKDLSLPSFKYGKLSRDRETTRIFQTYEILPNHKYYTSGVGNIPYAIIGIENKYELRQGLWQEVDITTPLLRGWISQMDNLYGYPPYGSLILDDNGNRLGIWYSSKQWTTVIIEENNRIAILTPEPPGFRGGN